MAPSTPLEKLVLERRSQKNTVTRIEAVLSSHTATPLTQTQISLYLMKTTSLINQVTETHKKIILIDPLDFDTHEAEYNNAIGELELLECGFKDLVTIPVQPTPTTTIGIRLPRIDLPKFNGDRLQWISFKELWEATVHNNTSTSKAEKLSYLISTLTGDAKTLIGSIPVTNANYDQAWQLLNERYEHKRELVFSIMQRFSDQPVVQGKSANSLRALVDVTKECLRSLKSLGLPVQHWDVTLVFYMMQKLDVHTKQEWEMELKHTDLPQLDVFFGFLEQRARALASGENCKSSNQSGQNRNDSKNRTNSQHQPATKTFAHHVEVSTSCKLCSGTHGIPQCPTFLGFTIPERREAVKNLSLCFNCLRSAHVVSKCTSKFTCQTCKRKHHTMLHENRTESQEAPQSTHFSATTSIQAEVEPLEKSGQAEGGELETIGQGLLATAQIKILDKFKEPKYCRALLDPASTTSFISEGLAQRLGLKRTKISATVDGLMSSRIGNSKWFVSLDIHAYFHVPGDNPLPVQLLVLPTITANLPIQKCDHANWTHLHNLQLADPEYYKKSKIDVLLGADVFWDIVLDGRKTGPEGSPKGINSTLGWLVGGKVKSKTTQILVHHVDVKLDEQLQRFWELDTVPTSRSLSKEEKLCEEHFVSTTTRNSDGKYMVSLPFKMSKPDLGSSRDLAMKRFLSLERRLAKNPSWYRDYHKFMEEYQALGHMEKIESEDAPPKSNQCTLLPKPNYIPHQFVVKPDSTTTKFRVVFDASAQTSNGKSLNDMLMVGPTIQDSLVDILMRFRIHAVAFTADIAKMYRQVLVHPEDTNYQRILWRDDPKDKISEYRLLTVTYGTASAPFHATRVLKQLAIDEKTDFPLASISAQKDFYMDDLMGSRPTVEVAIDTKDELLKMTERGTLPLRKWTSNDAKFLESVPPELREIQVPLSMDKDETVKTLGLHWNPGQDVFSFKVTLPPINTSIKFTKRMLLSEVAKIFDPLGWLAPAIIRAKILFQQLWKLDLGWDDPLPNDVLQQWINFRTELPCVESLSIPRCLMPAGEERTTLHGFCDASEAAYAAVVYLRVVSNNEVRISQLSSKTRVAPAKSISLPRLELCGGLLLTRLMTTVENALEIKVDHSYAWTDSTVVLAWIRASPSRWKTFVANRVSEIQDCFQGSWGHVDGVENPADCASRGISPSELPTHPLWWQGPAWLRDGDTKRDGIHQINETNEVLLEEKKVKVISAATVTVTDTMFMTKYSTLTRLTRVTSWCFRFIANLKAQVKLKANLNSEDPVRESVQIPHGPLTPEEIEHSLMFWVKKIQAWEFHSEILSLQQGKSIPRKSKLRFLNVFLDSSQILRVGGRLRNAPLHADQRTPIMLPRHHHITRLIIDNEHERTFHGGPQLVLSNIHRRFWIVNAKDAIRHRIKKCIVCTRHKPVLMQQHMADLPASRVTPSRAFLTTGVDYAGPFTVRAIPGRSKMNFKAYLCLFICFSTHAVHLEVVSALTTDAFIAALRRFISRRGKPLELHSDCGSNFVGANRELKELYALVNSTPHNNAMADTFSKDGIKWAFNPPGSPHFGGLWEAGVKSVKFHLHRVVGAARLTFEELTTFMTQTEACLNSRPLTPCSTDPSDLTVLTPGHFLIGEALTTIPDPDLTSIQLNRLSRWQHVQQLTQHFWSRWSKEYLSRLQQRPKWLQHRTNVKIDDMVLIKDDNLPPLKWQLGRIIATHPGKDGCVRVATIKTSTGDLRRSIVKLCLLPIDSSASESE